MSRDPLAEAGIDARSATVSDLVATARARPGLFAAIARALGDRPTTETAAALHELAALAPDKASRREVRRHLYRLRQRGVDVPEEPAATPAPRPRALAGEEPEGFLSFPDPWGNRLLWLVRPRATGGLWHLVAAVNEPGGLRECVLAEMTRKRLHALRDEMARRHGVRLVEIDWRYVDWLASEGFERARIAGTLGREAASFPQLRAQMLRAPAEPTAPPVAKGLDAAALADDAGPVMSSAALFAEPELGGWILPPDVLAPWIERFHEMRESRIVVHETTERERIGELVTSAIGELFSGEKGASWARLMAEVAWFFVATRRKEAADRALAVSIRLGHEGGAGIPFVEELVRRSFAVFVAEEQKKEETERSSSLILTPDQIREEQTRRRR